MRERLRRLDEALAGAAERKEELVIWASPAPRSQLRLARLLAWAAISGAVVSLAAAPLEVDRLEVALAHRIRATRAQLRLASLAWATVADPDPTVLEAFLRRPAMGLPHLPGALLRLLSELPWAGGGLTASERALLRPLRGGPPPRPSELLDRSSEPFEPALAWSLLDAMGRAGLVHDGVAPFRPPWRCPDREAFEAQRLRLGRPGVQALAGSVDWRAHERPRWRWDPARQRVVGEAELVDWAPEVEELEGG